MLMRCKKRCMAPDGGALIEKETILDRDTIPSFEKIKGHFVGIEREAREAKRERQKAADAEIATAKEQLKAAQQTKTAVDHEGPPAPPGGDLED